MYWWCGLTQYSAWKASVNVWLWHVYSILMWEGCTLKEVKGSSVVKKPSLRWFVSCWLQELLWPQLPLSSFSHSSHLTSLSCAKCLLKLQHLGQQILLCSEQARSTVKHSEATAFEKPTNSPSSVTIHTHLRYFYRYNMFSFTTCVFHPVDYLNGRKPFCFLRD